MAQTLRQIKQRIKSVNNTKKLTKAMEMVAASKLKKYQDLLGQTRTYSAELRRILGKVSTQVKSFNHPLFDVREPKNILVFLITSDSGLCGSYNFNLIQTTEAFLSSRKETFSCFSIGRQGLGYFRRKNYTVTGEIGIPRPQEIKQTAKSILNAAKDQFLSKNVDQVYLIYTEFISMASFKPKVEQLLPLQEIPSEKSAQSSDKDYILEPTAERILEVMIPHFLELKVEQSLKEALVSEQLSRMMAMRQATDNAKEMIDSLTLQRNKARQAAITKELIEIVSGSKAQQSK